MENRIKMDDLGDTIIFGNTHIFRPQVVQDLTANRNHKFN